MGIYVSYKEEGRRGHRKIREGKIKFKKKRVRKAAHRISFILEAAAYLTKSKKKNRHTRVCG
jgi:hypothetical protein